MDVYSPLEQRLSGLHHGQIYRVCLYNSYYWEQTEYQGEANLCQEFQLPSTLSSTAKGIDEAAEKILISETDELETIIGLLTGALIVILLLIVVAVLFWRSNRFANNKGHTLPQQGNFE